MSEQKAGRAAKIAAEISSNRVKWVIASPEYELPGKKSPVFPHTRAKLLHTNCQVCVRCSGSVHPRQREMKFRIAHLACRFHQRLRCELRALRSAEAQVDQLDD